MTKKLKMFSRKLFVIILLNIFLNVNSLPFSWRRSARNDSPFSSFSSKSFLSSSFNSNPLTFFKPLNSKFILPNFFQNLPKYTFGKLKNPQLTEIISFNSIDSSKPGLFNYDSYNSYDTILKDNKDFELSTRPTKIENIKPNKISFSDAVNETYEDDDVIVVPLTKNNDKTLFEQENKKESSDKNEQGLPSPIAFDPKKNQIVISNESKKDDLSDDLATSDDLEDSDFKVQYSDLHPVYIKPPSDFKPVLYPNREIDGSFNKNDEKFVTIQPILTNKNQERPYLYPNGLSSWILGGFRSMQRGGYWENLASDQSLHGYLPKNINEVNNNIDKLPIRSLKNFENNLKNDLIFEDENLNYIPIKREKKSNYEIKKLNYINDSLKIKKNKKLNESLKKSNLVKNLKKNFNKKINQKDNIRLKRNSYLKLF